jgi:hypothetical protein
MKVSAHLLRTACWTLAAVYVGGSMLLGSTVWLTASVLPETARMLVTGAAELLLPIWLSTAGALVGIGTASGRRPHLPVPIRRQSRIRLPQHIRFAPQVPVQR